ncbi:plastid-lipid-associated protein, chloroplastic-like [Gossypium australe]|uniref:Plastid-lipid-associated protein, chloroplastic-like n=1 Tax=Gossypium australe TaxID=47621 RepID=A0A5B6UFR1_9ROSI|nr:plastid-lipid-associated protein, chloroplastic-like [Gossypium australe]
MATIFQLNNFPYKTFLTTPKHLQSTSKPSILLLNSIKRTQNSSSVSHFLTRKSIRSRPGFQVFAADDDEGSPDKEEEVMEEPETESGGVVVAEAEAEEGKPKEEVGEIESLKKALVDSFYGTDRGWKASSETRAEIVELITLLEAKNPTPAPTDSLPLLNGKWILAALKHRLLKAIASIEGRSNSLLKLLKVVGWESIDPSTVVGIVSGVCACARYTSFTGLFPLLSRGQLRLVKVEEISQTIDAENLTVQNSVQFSGPLASSSISASAKFEVRSPRRVQIKFQEGIIGTPQLTDSIVLPENVEFMGQKIDLAPIKSLLNSVQDTASTVAKTISSRPPLKFSLSNSNSESWLLTTYLDEDLRISRDGGSVFVLIKEGSSLLTTMN